LMDEEVFRLATESSQYAEYVEPIPEGAAAALMLEFDSELVADFEAAIAETDERFLDDGDAFEAIEAPEEAEQADLWKLRKAAIPLLMSMEGDPKPYPFIEDATVPPDDLAAYVESFEAILDDHGTSAAYFAHAGAGTLHIRPVLNLKDAAGVETMHAIAEDVTDLVLEHHGAFSGEHGDGMARTEFNPKMYGPRLWEAFKAVKTAFDPDWLLNPGTVVYRDDPADPGPESDRGVGADVRDHLRYGPSYQSIEPATALDFEDEGGFAHLVELCNGCGTCRQTGSETMCPTYRASKEEIETTRGRANMLRAAISGDLPEEELYSETFQEEVLDLCVGCKGCANDCPTGVDMAKLKAEVKHQYHDREGASLRERLFANVDRLSQVGSALAPLSNWLQDAPGARWLAAKALGITPDRRLPSFRRQSLEAWFDARGGPAISEDEAADRVLLFPDTFTNYSHPEVGKAAVEVLEAGGVHVRIPDDVKPSGRAAVSEGFLDLAAERARHNVDALAPYVEEGWSIVCVEPSDVAVVHDEYADLLDGGDVLDVGAKTFGVCKYLDASGRDEEIAFDAGGSLIYHGHCQAKALNEADHVAAVLSRAGYEVDFLDSGCCGMAGAFGYEAEHYDLSMAIGRILDVQIEEREGDVVAPGASCRSQLLELRGERPAHPVEKLAATVPE
ncbi:MAG: FAD-binding and (Fe-S)-binding domain-containing protein, partial [Halanaeroarchaeum sp.]